MLYRRGCKGILFQLSIYGEKVISVSFVIYQFRERDEGVYDRKIYRVIVNQYHVMENIVHRQ